MGRDRFNDFALMEYENDEIERFRRLERESLMGDSGVSADPPEGNAKPREVRYTQ